MANPFSSACKSVETYSFNKTNDRKIDQMSEAAAVGSLFRKKQIEEETAVIESEMLDDELRHYYDKLNEGVVMNYVRESQIPNNINRISNIAKERILKDILFEVFYNSLLMDDSFLQENCDCIKCLTDKYVDDNGGFEVLNKAINSSFDNHFLKKVKNVCESLALEVCSRKLKDSKESGSSEFIDFDMTEDEKNKLDYSKKEDLDLEKIGDLVKNKVLTVVKDEKERQSISSELISKIEEDLAADENVKDEESLKEAMNKIILSKSVVEESTLFDALFRDAYHEFILENVAITSADKDNIDDFKEVSRNYDTEMDEDDALEDEEPVEDKEVNMDLILTEAITKYTLMETLYTLGFEDYSHENIKKLTERMLNPVSESAVVVKEGSDFVEKRGEFFKLFNKLKDDTENENLRTKMQDFLSGLEDDMKESFLKIANGQIDTIIEKNPKMEDKYNNLKDFLEGKEEEPKPEEDKK